MAQESELKAPAFDPQELRGALGSFATGVTVMTTLTADGERLGATVSSFNSVSLDPPLILFNLARTAQAFAAWEAAVAWQGLGERMDLCGLSTEHLFAEDQFFARLKSVGGQLHVDREGTGLGFDDELRKLPWNQL